jgi:hypothetical protein
MTWHIDEAMKLDPDTVIDTLIFRIAVYISCSIPTRDTDRRQPLEFLADNPYYAPG